ncbi:MAG: hypothetical protein K2K29_01625, partial [Muribaculaceae bacterium]|nr:hypothetical protein [Muribaculaceae bacterium]
IYDFLRSKRIAELSDLEKRPVDDNQKNVSPPHSSLRQASDSTQVSGDEYKIGGKLSYAQQKEYEKLVRKAERSVKDAEEEISDLEASITEMEVRIADGQCDSDLLGAYDDAQKKLESVMEKWEKASEELESIKTNNPQH